MKQFNNRCNQVSFIILILLTILTSCKKNKIKPYPIIPTKQISFSPSAAFIGDEITLTGEFDPDKTKNIVSFGGAIALITSASQTELKVLVPATAKNEKLIVNVNGVETASSTNFTLYNIFVAGTEYNGGPNKDKSVIKYWKNGILTTLTDGAHNAFATSMTINDKDVYVLGYENIIGYNNTVKYWKNGIPVSLTDGTKDAYPVSIKVIGNDVYVTGYEYSNYGWATIVKYWKNGIEVKLSEGLEEAYPSGIAISGTDVYVVGYAYDDYYNISPKLWKNGKESILSQPVGFSYYASDVAVIGNDVYITGTQQTVDRSTPIYWKNGVKSIIPTNNSSKFAFTTSIIIKDNSFYVTGQEQEGTKRTSFYWENGMVQKLSFSTNIGYFTSSPTSVAVIDNNMFVSGARDNAAAYWRNGTPTLLTDKKYYAFACAIVIAP
ncbi:hypothetical protein GM921_15310 [Pedobacter sp. LMG 31464]|uniref:IPT/TIG domain-containing protein n=1 Tax=Pedobacter planticolens TaxID=2679964 RepID=A0A923DZC5_9SPHI|nr:IPT/TIG domain-containing protein [Pedobacter planticolens]MBB2146871.1 hypothetical protein [Pedobacter planticolens]